MTVATNVTFGKKSAVEGPWPILTKLCCDESGQDLIEYALVFSFVALGAIASMKSLSTTIASVFASVGTTLTTAT